MRINNKIRMGAICFVIGIIGIAIGVSSTLGFKDKKLYGDKKESIEKIIYEQSIIIEPVSIISTLDLHDYRLVGFLEGRANLGVATFQKNSEEKYEYQRLERYGNKGIASFVLTFCDEDDTYDIIIVLSRHPRLEKIELLVNGELREERNILPEELSMTVFRIDDEEKLRLEINYYDIDGNLIEID